MLHCVICKYEGSGSHEQTMCKLCTLLVVGHARGDMAVCKFYVFVLQIYVFVLQYLLCMLADITVYMSHMTRVILPKYHDYLQISMSFLHTVGKMWIFAYYTYIFTDH